MKHLSIIILFALALGVSATFAEAQCTPVYGGGQSCPPANIAVNKTVLNPQTNTYVDNLGENDPKYLPEQIVNFQIVVTNTGGTSVSQVTLTDVLPQFVTFVSGPGSYDANTKTLTVYFGQLNPGESRSLTLSTKVVAAGSLPESQTITCPVNQANVTTSANQTVQDHAKFCVQKPAVGAPVQPVQPQPQIVTKGGLKVFPAPMVTKTPPTGPEMAVLAALLPAGFLGHFLRKKSVSR